MKNLLTIYFLFFKLIIQFSATAQTEVPGKIFNRQKIYLTEGQEKLAEQLTTSTVFQKREAIYEEMEKSSLKRVAKNTASNPRFYELVQGVLNDKSLPTTQKNDALKKMGAFGDNEDEVKMKQFLELTKKLNDEFPILKQLDRDTKARIYARSYQLFSQKSRL